MVYHRDQNGLAVSMSKRDSHMIVRSERLVAVRTLPHARLEALVDTLSTEHVTACLHGSVLEILTTDGTNGEVLYSISFRFRLVR